MKKLIYTFFATAALLFAAGCEREVAPVDKEGYVDAEFNVTFAQPGTKADISDGTTATQLVVGVYDKDGNAYVPTLSWPVSADHANAFSGLQAKFTARLVKGHGYDIVFLAQAPDNGAYTIDLAAKTLTAKTTGVSNDEARDAFYGTYSVDKVDGAISENVILKRPFAQINVIDLKEDYEAAAAALVNFGGSSLKVTAPTVLNLLDGTVGTPAEYNFSKGTMSMVHPDFDPYKTNGDYWLLDNYILAGTASSTVNLEFSLYDSALLTSYSVPNAPVQRNYRTNIYGSLLTSSGEFVVIIDPIYEGSNEFPIDGKTPEVTMQDSTLPAAGSTLNAEVNGTINLKAVHPIATIVPTYASTNTAVGTISADGVFTAVAPGTTVVTIKFPAVVNGVAVKSSDNTYSSYTITYTVVVKGADLADPELAVSGAPAAAVAAGESFNLTVATKSDGAVTVAAVPAEAVTIADPVSGVYKVTAAELAADTEVTLTVSQAATKVYNAGAKEVKFTVKGKAEVTPPATGSTIAQLKVAFDADKDNMDVTLGTIIVTGVDGKTVYAEDSTGGVLFYKESHGMEAGKSYTGVKVTKGSIYHTLYEVTEFDITNATVAEATVPVTTITLADLSADSYKQYESMHVKIEGVTFTDEVSAAKTTVGITKGDVTADAYIIPTTTIKIESVANVTGYVSYYSKPQVAVLSADDIVVTTPGKTKTKLSYNTAVNVVVGASLPNAATANVTGTISYQSSDPSVVTVAADGTLTGVAVGVATVTASIAATSEYTAASATCSVSVTATAVEYDEEVIDFSAKGYENSAEVTSVTGTLVSVAFDKGTNSNTPKYYTSGEAVRVYGGGTMTISSEKKIARIEITFGTGDGTNEITAAPGSYADGNWTGDANSVVFTVGGTTGNRRIKAIKVYCPK